MTSLLLLRYILSATDMKTHNTILLMSAISHTVTLQVCYTSSSAATTRDELSVRKKQSGHEVEPQQGEKTQIDRTYIIK